MTTGETLRNDARKAFADAGLTYAVLTRESMQRLRNLINERMKASGCIWGTFRCHQRGKVKITKWGRCGELRCKADYFDDREAVTFNADGFIGFAGWADSTNIVPIVEGFMDWLEELRRPTDKAGEQG